MCSLTVFGMTERYFNIEFHVKDERPDDRQNNKCVSSREYL